MASHVAKFTATLIHQREQREYPFEFILSQKLSGRPHLQKVAIELDDDIKQVLNRAQKLGIPTSPIRTITDPKRQFSSPVYYFKGQKKTGMVLKILQRIGASYKVGKRIFLPSPEGKRQLLLSFQREDFERDGQAEYIIRTGYENQRGRLTIHYTFLDHQFNPYYGCQHSTWRLDVRENNSLIFQQRLDKLQFLAFSAPTPSAWNREKIWVPVFVQKSPLPKVDQNPSVFALAGYKGGIPRINLLVPTISQQGEVLMSHRVFGNYQRREQLAKQLGKSWKQRLSFHSLLASPPHLQAGEQSVRVLMSVGKEQVTDYYALALLGRILPTALELDFIDYQIIPLHGQGDQGERLDLQFNQVYPSIEIDHSSYQFGHSDAFFAPFNEHMARVALLDSTSLSLAQSSVIKQKNLREKLRRFVQSFQIGDQLHTFLESNNLLLLLKNQGHGKTEVITAPLTRFSFLTGHSLRESVRPIVAQDGDTWRPALYVDSSAITARYVYSWIFDGKHLISPPELSISFPPHCRARDVSRWGRGFAYVFLCSNRDGNEWWFNFLPVKLSSGKNREIDS